MLYNLARREGDSKYGTENRFRTVYEEVSQPPGSWIPPFWNKWAKTTDLAELRQKTTFFFFVRFFLCTKLQKQKNTSFELLEISAISANFGFTSPRGGLKIPPDMCWIPPVWTESPRYELNPPDMSWMPYMCFLVNTQCTPDEYSRYRLGDTLCIRTGSYW